MKTEIQATSLSFSFYQGSAFLSFRQKGSGTTELSEMDKNPELISSVISAQAALLTTKINTTIQYRVIISLEDGKVTGIDTTTA
ncbi:hypothetical protein G9387_06375 [Enterobacter hormaechei]|uniref:hypothetical protein n=1 Tax=Enterobacteriaceae TaxID=543 RepID=UPI0013EFBACA|nr:hypothetical protein [Enterobacter hormaechei]KAF6706035.1 hypothetical protein G9393_07360 [Enterobacter hormaechei]KAF6712812.1 hypothetical protein G9387_06375 [Enterobacter hormaechei]